MLLRCSRHICRAIAIHGERQLAIGFASIYIGIGGSEHDPVRAGAFHRVSDLLRISNVRIFRTQSGHLIFFPLAHERFA